MCTAWMPQDVIWWLEMRGLTVNCSKMLIGGMMVLIKSFASLLNAQRDAIIKMCTCIICVAVVCETNTNGFWSFHYGRDEFRGAQSFACANGPLMPSSYQSMGSPLPLAGRCLLTKCNPFACYNGHVLHKFLDAGNGDPPSVSPPSAYYSNFRRCKWALWEKLV